MLSLDVGGGKIRAVIGNCTKGIAVIEDYFEVDTGDILLQSESAPEKLGGILRNAINERGITENKCVIPVRGTDIFFRRVSLPKSNTRRLKEMISHSLSGIPTIKEHYIDYMVEREHVTDGKNMLDILICGVPKKIAMSYYELASAAGLTPWRMDAQLNCIHKGINVNTEINGESLCGKSVLLLDVGSSLFGADLIVNAKSVFERTISMQRQSDPFDDAINKLSFGESQGAGSDRLYEKISEEAQKMTQFSLSRTLKSPVTRIYLYGEKSADLELAAYLTDSLGIQTGALSQITGFMLDRSKSITFSNIFGIAATLL